MLIVLTNSKQAGICGKKHERHTPCDSVLAGWSTKFNVHMSSESEVKGMLHFQIMFCKYLEIQGEILTKVFSDTVISMQERKESPWVAEMKRKWKSRQGMGKQRQELPGREEKRRDYRSILLI